MEALGLKQNLFKNDTRLYAVLDGASVKELPMKLYKMGPVHECLLPGEPTPEVLYAGPYLVHLAPDNDFTEWLLNEGLGNHLGIFFHSRASMMELRKHFRGLFSVVSEDGRPMLFRYYDPRVLRRFLPTCSPGELETFFGRVDTFFAEDEEGKSLLRFGLENNSLKQTELE